MRKSVLSLRVLIAVFLVMLPIAAFAHQPNYVANRKEIVDTEPTISKAYYGELTGQYAIYEVAADSDFELYLNILSPYNLHASKDFSVAVKDSKGTVLGILNDPPIEWTRWYEEYAGDWYWQGPELRRHLPSGRYRIIVQNPIRVGKYVLAIGEGEAFPPSEMPRMLKELYLVKTRFFGDPWYSIYRGVVGRYLIYSSITIVILVIFSVWILVRLIRKGVRSRQRAA
jgi:hypothetical protein